MQRLDRITKKKLGEILIEEGKITNNQLEEAIQLQKQTKELIGEIFVKLRYITEEDIAYCVASQYGLPYIDISKYMVNTAILANFTNQEIYENFFFPLDIYGKIMIVAIAGPINEEYFVQVEQKLSVNIFFVVSSPKAIRESIKLYTIYFKK